jgi:hypothetical protein
MYRNKQSIKALILILLVSALSCSRNKTADPLKEDIPLRSSIIIDGELKDSVELDISQIASDLKLVRLETNDSCVLGNLYQMIISDGYIFLGMERSYFLFKDNGEFLGIPVERGRGPEEVVTPSFSRTIRNDKLFFSDTGKNGDYFYFINLATGEQGRVPKAEEGYVDRVVHDSDTTLLYISNNYTRAKDNLSAINNYYVIRQDLEGNIIYRITMYEQIETSFFMRELYSLVYDPENIVISTPRCDTIFKLVNQRLEPVWTNVFTTDFDKDRFFQKVAFAELMHYSDDTIMIRRHFAEITIDKNNSYSRAMHGNRQLLLIDRLRDNPLLVNRLYFLDKKVELFFNISWYLDNNQFCIVVSPEDILYLLENPDMEKTVKNMIVQNPSIKVDEITPFDNPFLLIGKFR